MIPKRFIIIIVIISFSFLLLKIYNLYTFHENEEIISFNDFESLLTNKKIYSPDEDPGFRILTFFSKNHIKEAL